MTIPCTLESSCLSVDSSRWNCDGDKREIREREIRDANKGFRAFGGNPPKGIKIRCAWALGGSVSLRFAPFDSNCFEVSLCFAAFDSYFFQACLCKK